MMIRIVNMTIIIVNTPITTHTPQPQHHGQQQSRTNIQHICKAVTRHASHVTRHTSHTSLHTSHVTRHTSHITRHTSHIICHNAFQGCWTPLHNLWICNATMQRLKTSSAITATTPAVFKHLRYPLLPRTCRSPQGRRKH